MPNTTSLDKFVCNTEGVNKTRAYRLDIKRGTAMYIEPFE